MNEDLFGVWAGDEDKDKDKDKDKDSDGDKVVVDQNGSHRRMLTQ